MRWDALGPTDAAGRTGGTIAAMGKGIEIEAMKPVEIDHVLHAGKMVPRRWDRGSGKSGGGHSKGWSPFLLSEGRELFQM